VKFVYLGYRTGRDNYRNKEDKRRITVEQTLKSIREAENKKQLQAAAEARYADFSADK
jgi:DNA-binding MarR family transcriptional regulator